ncbi:hypothetical protein ACQ7HM_10725 [Williamsia sp. MIQD14]|uniref:hypothetical protein n=1 Tax=Williamsia sp. MIQD14 TaxID=3425703 RepID=UPI003DA15F58
MSAPEPSGGFGIGTLAAFYVLAVGAITAILFAVSRGESWQTVAVGAWAVIVVVASVVLLFVARKHIANE